MCQNGIFFERADGNALTNLQPCKGQRRVGFVCFLCADKFPLLSLKIFFWSFVPILFNLISFFGHFLFLLMDTRLREKKNAGEEFGLPTTAAMSKS